MVVIGTREFRRHVRRYLERVRAGETFVLAEGGKQFAEIRPIKPVKPMPLYESTLDRLVAEGRVRRPSGDLSEFLRTHPPASRREGEPLLSEILQEMRDEERY